MAEKVRVLVVDDEEVVLQSVGKVLKPDDEHEFVIDTALSASEGLDLMASRKYDLVVTDLMMPGIDGLQFIDRIRCTDRQTRIIMITGYATMRTALQALRKGAFDYIAKPFTKEELRNVVKNAARALKMPEAHVEAGASASAEYRSFFNQTYARILPDGTMRFGVEAAFLATIGEPLSIETAKVDDSVPQGLPFGTITNSNMRVFNLRAPFSGRILKVNEEVIDDVRLIKQDPRGKGWLLQVEPTDFENEIENLGS
jgi:CheY-like chemotaxis protein/glycine cleavage system H lipoate-binding protein